MENVKNVFDSIKEFVWDVIGYLIPGSFLLILLATCVKSNFFVSPDFGIKKNEFYPLVFGIVSYILGYVVYGFGWLKERILKKYSYVKQIEDSVSKRKAFDLSKKLLTEKLQSKGVSDDLSTVSVRDLRSLSMSFIPEADQKIYTFTFRAELSNQIGNICFVIGILGVLFSFFKKLPLQIFKTDSNYVILYCILVVGYFF